MKLAAKCEFLFIPLFFCLFFVGSSLVKVIEVELKLLNCLVRGNKDFQICYVANQTIDTGGFAINSTEILEEKRFKIEMYNKEVKFLAEKVAESFPELIDFEVVWCSVNKFIE